MELVEGPTLADRIAEGAIPVDEALPIASPRPFRPRVVSVPVALVRVRYCCPAQRHPLSTPTPMAIVELVVGDRVIRRSLGRLQVRIHVREV